MELLPRDMIEDGVDFADTAQNRVCLERFHFAGCNLIFSRHIFYPRSPARSSDPSPRQGLQGLVVGHTRQGIQPSGHSNAFRDVDLIAILSCTPSSKIRSSLYVTDLDMRDPR